MLQLNVTEISLIFIFVYYKYGKRKYFCKKSYERTTQYDQYELLKNYELYHFETVPNSFESENC